MKGFPKVLKTKEDYYNCLAMVASGELAAAAHTASSHFSAACKPFAAWRRSSLSVLS